MGVAAIPYIAMAAAAGLQYENTQHTAHRQDEAAAQAIRNQSGLQRQADAKVNDTVQKIAGSRSADAEQARLGDYMETLRRNRASTNAGMTPVIGSDVFKADSAQAANDTNGYAAKTAGLMARMDAPGIQRQNEGFDYGKLATDLGLVGRESQGQSFLDQVRMNGIRRNAKMDLAAGLLNAYAGSKVGGGNGATSGASSAGAGIEGAGNYGQYAGYA